MKKIKTYFELYRPYKFNPTDLTAIIFLISSILGIFTSVNITPLFLMGSAVSLIFCVMYRKINLLVLNGSLFVLNLVNFIKMF
jgi:hypothetical protein